MHSKQAFELILKRNCLLMFASRCYFTYEDFNHQMDMLLLKSYLKISAF